MNRLNRIIRYAVLVAFIVFALNYVMAEEVASKGDTVTVDYWLTFDGELQQTTDGAKPFSFPLGEDKVIPGFDKTVTGMKVGEEKSVTLSGADAYVNGPLAGKVLEFRIILLAIN